MYKEIFTRILKSPVYNLIKETPLNKGNILSKKTNNNIYFKREDLHSVFSFKIRGAYNKIINNKTTCKERGVIACSAGNHAQGVALSCKILNINCKIIMPIITPNIKINAVKRLGINPILIGDNYDESYIAAKNIAKKENRLLIHPYDDIDVIAGQGTIAKELITQHANLDAIFIPIGGGGLISGISVYIKNLYPEIKIIGVETSDSCSMKTSINNNIITRLEDINTFADGTSVKQVGEITFDITKNLVDDIILVSNDEVCQSIEDFYMDTRIIAEPSGVLSIAGCKKYIEKTQCINKEFATIISGANMDFKKLRFISNRSDAKEMFMVISIPEKKGSFKSLYNCIYPHNITEFSYRFSGENRANIYISFYYNKSKDKILQKLNNKGYDYKDLSNNTMAKDHGRYIIGGKSSIQKKELLYRFQFPEKPGELKKFLENLSECWNISLFHYRNQGDYMGRVLVGIQISETNDYELNKFLKNLGYKYYNETENDIYTYFLK